MRVLIVDDESPARERMRALMAGSSDCQVVAEAGNGHAALHACQDKKPDLVLLDIHMPGMDGLETARHLQALESPPAVVFCTAYSEHALKAFDANAIDYLVKPIRAERLARALEKVKRFSAQALGNAAQSQGNVRTHLCARVRDELKLVPINDVIYLRADQKYVVVRHTEGELLIEDTLTSLEAEFGERFLRIHRNALVARAWLSGFHKDQGCWVVRLQDLDETLEVSRRNLAAVRKVIKAL